MPSKQECNRIKNLSFDLSKVVMGYKGSMESRQGNRALDILDRAMSEIAQLEQSAWDEYRLSENGMIRVTKDGYFYRCRHYFIAVWKSPDGADEFREPFNTAEECREYLLSNKGVGRDFRRTDVYSSNGELIAEKGGE